MVITEAQRRTDSAHRIAKARITAQNQISVPKLIREHLGAGPGDDLIFEPRADGSAIVRRRKRVSILDLAGIAADQAHLAPKSEREFKRMVADGMAQQTAAKIARIARQQG